MFAKWGMAALVAVVAVQPTIPSIPGIPAPGGGRTFTVSPPTGGPAPSSLPAPPLFPRSDSVVLRLRADGSMAVQERISVPAGATMTRTMPLRVPTGDGRQRVYTVREPSATGNGGVVITADKLELDLGAGATTIRYTVDGAVADVGGRRELRWQPVGGWNRDLLLVRVGLLAPQPPRSVTCLSGPAGSGTPCETVAANALKTTQIVQRDFAAGDRMELTAELDPAAVAANARFAGADPVGPFALTWFSGAGLVALLALLLAGFALLWLLRGRAAKAVPPAVAPVLRPGAGVFGVLPGQAGTALGGHVGASDLCATVIDLAVRNYLLIVQGVAADGSPDWQLVRREPADGALTGYERVLLDTLLPPGRDSTGLSDLRTHPPDLTAARDALYADVAARRWFGHRPDDERGRLALAAAAVTVLGVLVTLVLAMTVGNALIGLAVVVAGLVLLVGAHRLPARGAAESVLTGELSGLRSYLQAGTAAHPPEADRETVFSRALPYAVALGQVQPWVAAFAGLDDGTGLYWYVPGEQPRGLAVDVPALLAALQATLAVTGPVRTAATP